MVFGLLFSMLISIFLGCRICIRILMLFSICVVCLCMSRLLVLM